MSGHWFRKHRDEYPPDWERIARRIKQRARWRCEACDRRHGPGSVLGVHHLDGMPQHCADDNLVALCSTCHLRAHTLRPMPATKVDLLGELRRRFEIGLGQLCFAFTTGG